ncbi:hypothetical protein Q1695_005130 [Nippostrongylus brasiliensis]|nr:hypothetical protein Q1695_005130 [Nippostrongylus brasiliensis]
MITIRLLSNSGSAVVYFSIIAYMTSIHNRTLLTISPSQKRLHRTAKFTLGMVMLNSISLLFIPDVLLLINPFNIAQKYAPFLYSLTLTKAIVNFIIYLTCYREIRGILFRTLCRRISPKKVSGNISSIRITVRNQRRPPQSERNVHKF